MSSSTPPPTRIMRCWKSWLMTDWKRSATIGGGPPCPAYTVSLRCAEGAAGGVSKERAWHAAKRHDHHPAPAAYEQHQLLHTALRLAHALWPAALPTLGALGAEAFGRAVLALGQRTLDAT